MTKQLGMKADHGKPILGAIPPHAELAVGRVLTFGAEKYARDAWQAVENAEVRYMDAALRHLNAHRGVSWWTMRAGKAIWHMQPAASCFCWICKSVRGLKMTDRCKFCDKELGMLEEHYVVQEQWKPRCRWMNVGVCCVACLDEGGSRRLLRTRTWLKIDKRYSSNDETRYGK